MDTAIIVALISLVGSLVGTFTGILASSKLTIYRIEQLEKKVDRFTKIEEEFYDLNTHNKLQDQKIETLENEQLRIIEDIKDIRRGDS